MAGSSLGAAEGRAAICSAVVCTAAVQSTLVSPTVLASRLIDWATDGLGQWARGEVAARPDGVAPAFEDQLLAILAAPAAVGDHRPRRLGASGPDGEVGQFLGVAAFAAHGDGPAFTVKRQGAGLGGMRAIKSPRIPRSELRPGPISTARKRSDLVEPTATRLARAVDDDRPPAPRAPGRRSKRQRLGDPQTAADSSSASGGKHRSTHRDRRGSRRAAGSRARYAGGSRCARSAGLTASKPSSTAELRQTTSVPSALLTVLAASSPASTSSASSARNCADRRRRRDRPSGVPPNVGSRRFRPAIS